MNSPSSERWPAVDGGVVAALIVLAGVGSLWLGPDVSCDLRNYHFYNGYAFLTSRLGRDVAPAAMGTFFNPVLDGFHYWGMVHLPAKVFGFVLGALSGLNPAIVYLMARTLFAGGWGRLPAVAAAVCAALGPGAVLLLGTSTGDGLAATPVLLALLLVMSEVRSPPRVILAGALAGIATALKLTMAPYAVALAVALLLSASSVVEGLATTLVFGIGSAGGYLVVAGFWCLELWRLYGNPIFPFANTLFHSPFLDRVWMRDTHWQARTLWDYLSPPWDMASGNTARLQEFPFRDARLLALVAVGLGALARRTFGPAATRSEQAWGRNQRLVLVFVGVSYLLWLTMFYYYRYLIAIEYLTPVALYILLRGALPRASRTLGGGTYVAVLLGLVLFTRVEPRGWGRGEHWQEGWFVVRLPRLASIPNAIVLMDVPGNAFIIPYFPSDDRFFLLHHGGSNRFDEEILGELERHTGPILYLPPIGQRRLSSLGLRDRDECEPLRTDHGRFQICLAEHEDAIGSGKALSKEQTPESPTVSGQTTHVR